MHIGLLGAQNSHARHFCTVINGEKRHEGYVITALYGGDDPDTAAALCAEYGITYCATEEDVIAQADAIVITYRKGSQHHAAAMKALKAGKPVFVDKPFTTSVSQTAEIVDYAKEHNILLTGGTSMKSLDGLAAPAASIGPGSSVVLSFAADPVCEYDGYWFYGMHTAEVCIQLCGEDFTDVVSFRNGSAVVSTVNYPDRQCVIVTSPDSSELHIAVTNGGKTEHFPVAMNYQSVCPDEFVTMLKTGREPRRPSHYQKSTELMARIVASAGL